MTNFTDSTISVFWNRQPATLGLRTITHALPVTSQPHGATAGDFDGDGDLDVATVNGGRGTASVYLNDGRAGFTELVTHPSGGWVIHVTTGDFNDDGRVDYATVDQGSGSGTVYLNGGDGTFRVERSARFLTPPTASPS